MTETGHPATTSPSGHKFYRCPHCDAVRGTEDGVQTHVRLKHSDHAEV